MTWGMTVWRETRLVRREAPVIARRRRVSFNSLSAERFARPRQAVCPGAKRPWSGAVIARRRWALNRPKAEGFPRRMRALCPDAKRP